MSNKKRLNKVVHNLDIEQQYQFYLDKIQAKEVNMGDTQKKEMRQAFYAGCAQMYLNFTKEIPTIRNDNDTIKAVQHLDKQLKEFWGK